jgi:hypothetical protein
VSPTNRPANAEVAGSSSDAIAKLSEVGTAEQFFTGGLPFEMLISNLGIKDLHTTGPIRPTALWGPLTLTQIDGEYVTGIVTYQGQLRMVTCGYTPTKTFLDDVRTTLVDAS